LSYYDWYDWFAVSLTAGKKYYFNTTGGSGDTYGRLYRDTGGTQLVAADDDSGEEPQAPTLVAAPPGVDER